MDRDTGLELLASRLGRVRHFAQLPESARRAIVAAGEVRRFPAGAIIFLEGTPCAGMFVLLSGRVHLCRLGPRGQQHIMAVIEPVIMFNEVAVLDGGPNPLMAVAVDDSTTWCISHRAFHDLLQRYPIVGLALLPLLAKRNRILLARCEDLANRSVLARTAKRLLDLSRMGQQPIDRSLHSVEDIASHVGSVREPVSRAIAALRDEGLIHVTRDAITVVDRNGLARAADLDLFEPR